VNELAAAHGRAWAEAWAGTPDEELAARIRRGDTALYEVLMRRYNQRLYRVARAIVRNDAEAEDVVQQAFVNAYRHFDQFAQKAKLSTWMTKIAVYEALARVRKRERAAVTAFDESAEETMKASVASSPLDPERQALTAELRVLLEQAIDGLRSATGRCSSCAKSKVSPPRRRPTVWTSPKRTRRRGCIARRRCCATRSTRAPASRDRPSSSCTSRAAIASSRR
jgi:RNA polymerase sigma factor (sigma-70 family)